MSVASRRLAFVGPTVLAALIAAFGPASSRAGAAEPPARESRRVVIILAGPQVDVSGLESSLSALLAAAHLEAVVRRADRIDESTLARGPDTGDAVARVTIDLRSPWATRVRVAAGDRDDAAIDRTLPREGSGETAREEIAQVVQSSVEGILARPEPPAPATTPAAPVRASSAPTPASPASERSSLSLDLAVFGGARPFGSGVVTAGLGGGAGLSFGGRGAGAISIWLSGVYHVPFDAPSPAVTVHTTVTSLRLLPTIGLFASERLRIDAGAGGGVDIFDASPREGPIPIARLAPTRTTPTFVLAAAADLRVRVSPGTEFLLTLGVDADTAPRRYATRDASGIVAPVFEAARLRPYALAGVSFSVLGGGAR